ncbi:hypothetical protein [Sporosarcina sp. NPDC096371]|uniref:hypothetical protein n=1 Tax=Sporosarcina sp. NPDC096371 TaxID=3364530 RepID=UPI0037F4D9B8
MKDEVGTCGIGFVIQLTKLKSMHGTLYYKAENEVKVRGRFALMIRKLQVHLVKKNNLHIHTYLTKYKQLEKIISQCSYTA